MPFAYHALVKLPDPARVAPTLKPIEDDSTPDQTAAGVDRDGKFRLRWSYPVLGVEQPCSFVVEQATFKLALFSDAAQDPLVLGENGTWRGEADWTTALHPANNSNSYHPLYTDGVDLKLTMIEPISLPQGRATLSFLSSEDIERGHDFARVEVSANGGLFFPVANYSGPFSGVRRVDLSEFAGQDVVVRFRFLTDDSAPVPPPDGWFIDNITLETSDFSPIGTVDSERETFLVVPPQSKTRFTEPHTRFFRVKGLFGNPCSFSGPYSNEREITIDPGDKGPH